MRTPPPALKKDFLLSPEQYNKTNRNLFPYRPVLIQAKTAHQKKQITFEKSGKINLHHPHISPKPITIKPYHYFSNILPIYQDVYNTVSEAANSPQMKSGTTLKDYVESAYFSYLDQLSQDQESGLPEANIGSYVFDPLTRFLYLIPPEDIFRISLITSHSLYNDPQNRSVFQLWHLFESTTIAIAGMSIGSNIADACLRNGMKLKVADMDHTEAGNLLRMNRTNLNHLSHPTSLKNDPTDSYEVYRPPKAAMGARELLLINPYLDIQVFLEGVTDNNHQEFLQDASAVFDEIDDIPKKIDLRKWARDHQTPLGMVSDFDHRVAVEWTDYASPKQTTLCYQVADKTLLAQLDKALKGDRQARWQLVELIVGKEFFNGPFGDWAQGKGEHATSSIPQHGTTAMGAGFYAAWIINQHVLGNLIPPRTYFTPEKVILNPK